MRRQRTVMGEKTSLLSRRKIVGVVLLWITCLSSVCTSTNNNDLTSNPPRRLAAGDASESTKATAISPLPSTSNTSTVILTETELYDGQSWQAVSWNDASTGDPSPSPSDYPDPSFGGSWISDWKIVTGPTRDDFGWEYKTNRKRRRTWIRTYEINADAKGGAAGYKVKARPTAASSSSVASSVSRPSRVSPISRLTQSIRDSYNFKGFGLTFYKSLVFRESFGLALRVPLTFNFALWEEHPSLPSVGASIAIYHPWVVCLFISTSLRMEVLQWAFMTTIATIVYVVCWLIWTILLRGLIVACAAILFPITRRLYQPTFPLAKPNWLGPEYSRSVEERLGISWSWRLSQARGYERRVGCWHYFAHSLVALLKAWNVQNIPTWVVRRVAAAGTSISTIPDQPFITANSLLSLSGIYFAKRNTGNKKHSLAEESVSAALKHPIASTNMEDDGDMDSDDNQSMDQSSRSASMTKLVSKGKAKVSS